MKTNLMLLLALTASSLTAADIVWNPSVSSGAYNDGASWTGGVAPTAEDTPTFRQSGTVDVSAKADGAFQSLKVIASGGDLSVNLNPSPISLLGSRELLVAGASTACATLHVTGGVVANMLRVRLGDSAPNGTLCVTGDGTKMAASGDNTIVGFHHPNCALEVLDGARFTSARVCRHGDEQRGACRRRGILLRRPSDRRLHPDRPTCALQPPDRRGRRLVDGRIGKDDHHGRRGERFQQPLPRAERRAGASRKVRRGRRRIEQSRERRGGRQPLCDG